MADFANDPVDVEDLPALRDEAFVTVHPNHLRVALVGKAIFATIAALICIVVAVLLSSRSWIPLVVLAGVLVLTMLDAGLTVVEVRHIGYQVREHDVTYRSGVLVKTVATVPFVRVQHARLRQGPLQRAFGLATVEVNSAGPDLRIRGLDSQTAERLKALVVERAGDLDEQS